MPTTLRVCRSWPAYRHYHQWVLAHKLLPAVLAVGYSSRNYLFLDARVCQHSTLTQGSASAYQDSLLTRGSASVYQDSLLTPLNARVCQHSSLTPPTKKWEKPQGYDSNIMIYHPVLKEKVPLILLQEKLAQWYSCGPTVYDSIHIGHASSYVRLDIIRRILAGSFGIDTTFVMGVTDIDDKIIHKSKQTGQTLNELTQFYECEFFASLAKMNVSPPSLVVRVTDHVGQIISFIAGIEAKGLAYRTDEGNVYFEVSQYSQYGVFVDRSSQGRAAEIDPQKRAAEDFALWKASKPGEPSWGSPWGQGRPGWHIECSAMASKIFGANFDIHTGGEDLAFPHHENELAQSCVYHSRSQWANYWIHTGHLFLSGQSDKMSKSLKNVISVTEFLQDYTPNHFRMLCLLNNYRNRIEYSAERMAKAVSTMATLNSIIHRCDAYVKGQTGCADVPEAELYEKLLSTRLAVTAAFADDFNTPKALANLMRLVKFTNQFLGEETSQHADKVHVRSIVPVAAVGAFVGSTLTQLGLDVGARKTEVEAGTHQQLNKAVDTLVCSRTQLRQFAKDKQFFLTCAGQAGVSEEQALKLMKKLYLPLWKISDKIRTDMLSSTNVQISDDAENSTWSFVDVKKPSESSGLREKARDENLDVKK